MTNGFRLRVVQSLVIAFDARPASASGMMS